MQVWFRDETDTDPLRCPHNGSNYACHNRALQFVKSLARDAGFHAPKGDVCLRESAPGVIGLRADVSSFSLTRTAPKTSSSILMAVTPL
jgi:hypothetical protein